MAFLQENTPFPPIEHSYLTNKYNEWKVWYSGDAEELAKFYSYKIASSGNSDSIFWGKIEKAERADCINMPLAGDIASKSSKLLFSETPKYIYENNESNGANIIKEFIDDNGFNNILLEGAELAAALGGCVLKLNMDKRLSNVPICSIITPINFFPTFIYGRLFEILFYREIKISNNGNTIYRLFENRKRSKNGFIIEFKLYKGTIDKVGKIIDDIYSLDETKELYLEPLYINNVNGLGCEYIPNMRPNRLIPGSSIGINDYNGCIAMLDGLDLAWTSLVRDLELGMGQLLVDEELLTREESDIFGTRQSELNKFSKFSKCFLKLNFSNCRMGGDNIKPIDIVQFEIRVNEHISACEKLTNDIILMCGYSPSTFGLSNEGRAESGTALRIRERASFLTREQKSRYWQPAIKSLLNQVQQMYNFENNKNDEIENIKIELEDSIIVDSKEQSEVIKNLDQARAISTYIKVKMQHQDWDDKSINDEVDRILKEEGIEENINLNE